MVVKLIAKVKAYTYEHRCNVINSSFAQYILCSGQLTFNQLGEINVSRWL